MMVQAKGNERDIVRAEEAFVVDAQVLLHELMEKKNLSKADLASAMGVSRARVSQILSDDCKNFTVRLLARAMFALGEKPEVTCLWLANQRAAAEQARNNETIRTSHNVHELWTEAASEEDELSACNDDDARIKILLEMAA